MQFQLSRPDFVWVLDVDCIEVSGLVWFGFGLLWHPKMGAVK